MGSGFGGLTEGLWQSVSQARAEQERNERATAEREAKVLTILADSDDPEIRSMAVAGMLEQANPRRKAKGLRGFFGEMERSETLPRIRALLDTPVEKPVTTPGLPSRGIPVQRAMSATPAALPSRSPVEGGAPPPPGPMPSTVPPARSSAPPAGDASMLDSDPFTPGQQITGIAGPITLSQPPPGSGAFTEMRDASTGRDPFTVQRDAPRVGRTDTVMAPRQVFLDPAERIRRDTIAREQAKVEGEVAGLVASGIPEQEARELVKQQYLRAGRGYQGVREGNVRQLPDGSWVQDLYDPMGNVVSQIPATDPRLTRPGAPNYSTAMNDTAGRLFGLPYASLNQEQKQITYDTWRRDNPAARAEVSAATTRAAGDERIRTEMNMPLSIDDNAQTNTPVGTTKAQLAGQVPQTPQHEELRRNSEMLKELLPNVKETIRAALPSETEIFGNWTPGLVMKARRLDPAYRKQIAAMESAVNLLVNNIARVVGGAKGAQSEMDAKRAEAAVLNLKEGWINGDTAESAEKRIDEAMAAIDAVIKSLPAPMVPQTPGAGGAPANPTAPANPAAPGTDQADTQTGYRLKQVVRLKDGTYREITGVNPLRWKAATAPAPAAPAAKAP